MTPEQAIESLDDDLAWSIDEISKLEDRYFQFESFVCKQIDELFSRIKSLQDKINETNG